MVMVGSDGAWRVSSLSALVIGLQTSAQLARAGSLRGRKEEGGILCVSLILQPAPPFHTPPSVFRTTHIYNIFLK